MIKKIAALALAMVTSNAVELSIGDRGEPVHIYSRNSRSMPFEEDRRDSRRMPIEEDSRDSRRMPRLSEEDMEARKL